jgi:DNA primase
MSQGRKPEKRKLSICLQNGIYHCWVCEAKGNNIGKPALKFAIQKNAAKELNNYFKKGNNEVLSAAEKNVIELPKDFRLIGSSRDVTASRGRKYLEARGFKAKDIWRYKVGVSEKYSFKNRVIFTSFDSNQNLNYYTARTYDKNNKKRYYNCQTSRKDIIFNEFDIDFSKQLILVEGVFDLLHCPKNATCLLGSWLNEKYSLFKKIVKYSTPIILCLDPDAIIKTQKIAKLLYEYCIDVKISKHKSNKDFGDMNGDEVKYWIDTAKPYDNIDRMTYLINEIKSGSMF